MKLGLLSDYVGHYHHHPCCPTLPTPHLPGVRPTGAQSFQPPALATIAQVMQISARALGYPVQTGTAQLTMYLMLLHLPIHILPFQSTLKINILRTFPGWVPPTLQCNLCSHTNFLHSFVPKTCSAYNNLPDYITHANTLSVFKVIS